VYIWLFMFIHSAWYQPSQLSHATSRWFHFTALLHIMHGYLSVRGPGFCSQSDDCRISMRLRYSRWCLFP
jgi:hypothetical protein